MSDNDPKDPPEHEGGAKADPHEVVDHPDPHPSEGPKGGVEGSAGPSGSKDPKN